ncbi:MAG: RNA methyltransferase [Chlorobi bacterium]|nr:RNA methyltransferase [Chlorobiota bacterium]
MNIYLPGIQRFPMLAKTAMGLEDILAGELLRLGAEDIRVLSRAVAFKGDKRLLYSANYNLRTALRVLRILAEFPVENEPDVYRKVMEIPWQNLMEVRQTFIVDAISFSPLFRNSMYLAQRVKDGIADRFRKETGRRPNIDKDNPDIRVNILVSGKKGVLSLDSSGESLHKRGYRVRQGLATLNEVLAAGMILKSGWHAESHFIDPMCGSGTLPIEAAMYALGIPPGFMRKKYGFIAWKDFDASLYQSVRNHADIRRKVPFLILGSDRSAVAIRLARMNVSNTGLEESVKLKILPMHDLVPPSPPGTVMFDPPFGKRMKIKELGSLYYTIGTDLKRNFGGYESWILTGVPKLLKNINLKVSEIFSLNHGGLDVRLVHYRISQRHLHEEAENRKKPRRPRIGNQEK